MKRCNMCGVKKTEQSFRLYPNEETKRYPYCLDCQSIETRRRYLIGLGHTAEENVELAQIEQLYALRLKNGLRTFGMRKPRVEGESVASTLVLEQLKALGEEVLNK